AGGTPLALHFHHCRHRGPEGFRTDGGPGIGPFAHRGGRGDGIAGDHFVEGIGKVRYCFVSVHGLEFRTARRTAMSLKTQILRVRVSLLSATCQLMTKNWQRAMQGGAPVLGAPASLPAS